MLLDAVFRESHRVVLILPFHLRQIHTAVVGLLSLFAVSVLKIPPRERACKHREIREILKYTAPY